MHTCTRRTLYDSVAAPLLHETTDLTELKVLCQPNPGLTHINVLSKRCIFKPKMHQELIHTAVFPTSYLSTLKRSKTLIG